MTLLFIDGFASNGTNTTKWSGLSGTPSLTSGRFDSANGGWNLGSADLVKIVTPAQEHDTFICGFALNTTLPGQGGYGLMGFCSDGNGTVHTSVGVATVNPGGSAVYPTIKRGDGNSGTVLATSNILLTPNQWNYIEFKAKLHDTAGTVELWINDQLACQASGVDTRNGGTKAVYDSVRINWPRINSFNIDDFYLANGAGTINNSFLGDCVIETLYPDGNGDVSGFLGSDGNSVDNYLLVNETGAPTSTGYVYSNTIGAQDLYTLANPVRTNALVRGVQVVSTLSKSDAGACDAKILLKTNGTVYNSGLVGQLISGYIQRHNIWENNPFTGAGFTGTELQNLQVGVERG